MSNTKSLIENLSVLAGADSNFSMVDAMDFFALKGREDLAETFDCLNFTIHQKSENQAVRLLCTLMLEAQQ